MVGKYKESETFVEIGGYVHQDEGRARAKLYVGDVNRPLMVDDAALTKRLKRVRVTMNVAEDKSVHKNQVYEKDINMVQEILDEPNTKGGVTSTEKNYNLGPDGNGNGNGSNKDGLTPLQVLKNFVDNIAADVRQHGWMILGVGLIAAAALVAALIAIAK